MSLPLKTRRKIMIGFFAVFFVCAPLLVLYASGYRYDARRGIIIQTGTLFLEATQPIDADIFLNDELYPKRLTKKLFIYNLLPGTYRVRLEQIGYNAWEKEVSIGSRVTTFEKDIILFKRSIPRLVVEGNITRATLSPDKKLIAHASTEGAKTVIRITDPVAGTTESIYSFPLTEPVSDLVWSGNSRAIALRTPKRLVALTVREPYRTTEFMVSTELPDAIAWADTDDALYMVRANELSRLELTSKRVTRVEAESPTARIVPSILSPSGIVYYAVATEQGVVVKRYSPLLRSSTTLALVPTGDYVLSDIGRDSVTLTESRRNRTYIISLSSPIVEGLIPVDPVTQISGDMVSWDEVGTLALISDFGELRMLRDNKIQFITRYGSEISGMAVHPSQRHAILALTDRLILHDLEISTQAIPPIELARMDSIAFMALGPKAQQIYFVGVRGDMRGLYTIDL